MANKECIEARAEIAEKSEEAEQAEWDKIDAGFEARWAAAKAKKASAEQWNKIDAMQAEKAKKKGAK